MKRKLRTGFSTGTAASAAVKAAMTAALGGGEASSVQVTLPGGRSITIYIEAMAKGRNGWEAWVIKDGGDDPDCTHGALIGAKVAPMDEKGVTITSGEGVGTVTLPGLPVPVGEPAVNPVPRRMIEWAVKESYEAAKREIGGARVEISVEEGERLAKETLNPRLGIIGGLSILGTTGIVRPFSHGAYRATIFAALKVARAAGLREVILTTGSTSDEVARSLFPHLPEVGFVQMADYVGFTVERLRRMGFARATVVCFFGKLVKMAQGMSHTHASAGSVDLDMLAKWIVERTGDQDLGQMVAHANTARGALQLLLPHHRKIIEAVGERAMQHLNRWAGRGIDLCLVLLDYQGTPLMRRGT